MLDVRSLIFQRRLVCSLIIRARMTIAADRISMRGYGEAYPVAANDTAANRQLNRRVEIVLSDDTGMTKQRG